MSHELEEVPAVDKVAVGIATKLGIVGTVILAVCSAVTTVLVGYHGQDTRLLATLATVIAVATIIGRMAQAIAKELSSGKVTFSSLSNVAGTLRKGVDEAKVAAEPAVAAKGVRKPTSRRRTS